MRKKIFLKISLAALPILLMAAFYLYADPFMILYHYDDYHTTAKTHLELNEDYVVTEDLLKAYPENKFDSYVFGSSRSRFFVPEQWATHISSKAIFQYGVASETLYGIASKISFLQRRGIKIKNALVIIDDQLLEKTENSNGHLFKKHPLISGESNMDFQFSCFIDFFSLEAVSSYITLCHKPTEVTEDPQIHAERIIEQDRDSYYGPRMSTFYKRDTIQLYSQPVINDDQKKLLLHMKQIFDADSTDYRIVISPMYDQQKPATSDMHTLYGIFGENRIYDFSGINDITDNIYNYFETAHYRPMIAYRIMDSVYARRN